MSARYEVGKYQANEAQILFRGRLDRQATARPIIFLHGRSYTAEAPHVIPSLHKLLDFLSDHGYGALSIDAGGQNTWGSNQSGFDSQTALSNAIAWVRGVNGFASAGAKVLLLTHSMGFFVAHKYAIDHPTDVAGIVGGNPGTNLARWHNDAAYTAGIDSAFGGNYAANAVGFDPILVASSMTRPVRCYTTLDDDTVPTSEVDAYIAACGASNKESIHLASGGHTQFWDGVDRVALLAWLDTLTWS